MAQAQQSALVTTIHSFSAADQIAPTRLVRGGDGNFYGTTSAGGAGGDGTVFRITPAGVVTTLYTFTGGSDESNPSALALGSDGNFYGTTPGNSISSRGSQDGTVFQITPAGVFTTLYTFSGSDGEDPVGSVTPGSDGNLYGTTEFGGTGKGGTAFRITPAGVLTVLHDFSGDVLYEPESLVTSTDGNFYGLYHGFGADAADGGIFQLTPEGQVSLLYENDFAEAADLVAGSDGDLYGYDGYIFQIDQPGTANTFTNIYNPASNSTTTSGSAFSPTLLAGSDGNLYGTSYSDGLSGDGTLFQLTPAGVFTVLYNFSGSDGANPTTRLVQNGDGTFYGTTSTGGANGDGTFFQLTVSAQPAFFAGEKTLSGGVYFLTLPDGNLFGYYSFLEDPHYLYHFDLGYEYVFDAEDGNDGVYLYDFASSDFFYTSPTFPFPYLYDFNLQSVVYYFPDAANGGHYTTNPRYFYVFSTGETISK